MAKKSVKTYQGFGPEKPKIFAEPYLQAVDSSAIAALAYDKDKQEAVVKFRSGREYAYEGVSRQRFQAWSTAYSKGRYLNQVIKRVYPFRRLG